MLYALRFFITLVRSRRGGGGGGWGEEEKRKFRRYPYYFVNTVEKCLLKPLL